MASVDRLTREAALNQLIAESLGIDPHVVEQETSLLPATDLVTISTGQLVSLMDKMLDVALAGRVDTEHAGGNGGSQVPPLRLSEAIDGLILASRAEGRADSTLEWYRKRISKFVRFSGDGYIGDFQTSDIRAFTASLYDQGGLSGSYIAGILRAVKRLFSWCEEEGYLVNNPMERIKIPKPDDIEPKFITWGDFLRLLATTQGSSTVDRRDAAEMLVLYDTGCRASELCALKVDDVYLEDEQLKRWEKKVKKERRGPILDAVVQSIRAWLEVRPEVDTDALFVNLGVKNFGEPITPNSLRLMLKRRAELAGITGRVNPHSFRHARGRDYVMTGGDTTTGSVLLGHTNVQTFSRFYARFGIGELQEKHAKHNMIAGRLGYAEMQPPEVEDALPPLEFVAELEIVDIVGLREVERHFERVFGERQQMSTEELLNETDDDERMLEHLLDYCGTPGFGFEIVFPLDDSTTVSGLFTTGDFYEVSNVVVGRLASHIKQSGGDDER